MMKPLPAFVWGFILFSFSPTDVAPHKKLLSAPYYSRPAPLHHPETYGAEAMALRGDQLHRIHAFFSSFLSFFFFNPLFPASLSCPVNIRLRVRDELVLRNGVL